MVLVIAPGLNHFYLSIKRNMLLGGQSLRRIKRVFTHNGKQQKLQVGLFNRMWLDRLKKRSLTALEILS